MRGLAAICLLVAAFAATAAAETAPRKVFQPAEFERFSPLSALDLVQRIPGFQLSVGGGGRGFGQGGSNVLINGERVSGKSISVRDVLGRIPVDQVRRIEWLEAGTVNLPGVSGPVVNVIVREARFTGTWRFEATWRRDVSPALSEFDVSFNGTQAGWAWSVSLENLPERGSHRSFETLFDGEGTAIETRRETFALEGDRRRAGIRLRRDWGQGIVSNLNGLYVDRQRSRRGTSAQRPFGSAPLDRFFPSERDDWEVELGGDVVMPVAPASLRLIGLFREAEASQSETSVDRRPDGTLLGQDLFVRHTRSGERIVRSELDWPGRGERDWQVSLEGAFNFLDRNSDVFEAEADGPLRPVALEGGSVRVEEARAETFVTVSDALSGNASLQVSLGAEYSEIRPSGDTGDARRFMRPKGLLVLTYEADDRTVLNASLERAVGQLDFGDFASSVNLDEGETLPGNPELVPDQTWSLELEVERDLGAGSAASVSVFYDAIEDPITRLPLGESADGPGNADGATRYGIDLDTTLELDRLGLPGGLLELGGFWRDSRIEDPVTRQSRRLSNARLGGYEVSFRQDVMGSAWAWGVGYEADRRAPRVRRDEIRRTDETPGWATAFVEHKDLFGMVGRLRLQNALDREEQTVRTVFVEDRPSPVDRVEDRVRTLGPIVSFQMSGTF